MIRILSFNIHGGYDRNGIRDLKRIHAMMQELDIDIGVFQEMETRASRGGALDDIEVLAGPERPHRLPGLAMKEGEGWYGNLIVSRYPLLRSLVHNLGSARSFEPRNAVDALSQTPLGYLRIIGTHLSLTPWERWSEMHNLVTLMDGVEEKEKNPLLLMGDINEWQPRSRLLNHLDKILKPVPCGKSFPSSFPLFRLDRVWHDRCHFPVSARTLADKKSRHFSDHLPVLITLG
ncbi:MAG: Endonuclease/exonuclease/phosphatase [Micavibrio sp.]|nr:Endonuclease/exonuclease/phosphatase [Micavibrio sp.]